MGNLNDLFAEKLRRDIQDQEDADIFRCLDLAALEIGADQAHSDSGMDRAIYLLYALVLTRARKIEGLIETQDGITLSVERYGDLMLRPRKDS